MHPITTRVPFWLIRRPFQVKMPQNLWDELPNFHDGNVFSNTRPYTAAELGFKSANRILV